MYSLSEMARELERQNAAKVDYVADTRQLHFVSKEDRSVIDVSGAEEAQDLVVNDVAHGQIASRLGIPQRYYERLRGELPTLLDENVNRLFRHQPERRMIRTLDGTARAFLSDRYRRLDNYDVAEQILPLLGEIPDVRIESAALTDTRMYVKAVTPRVAGEVEEGDEVCAGVVVRNSEVGYGALTIEPMVYRLVCSNGMIVPDHNAEGMMRRVHVGRRVQGDDDSHQVFRDETMRADDRAFFLALGDVVRAAVSEVRFRELVSDMSRAARSEPVRDPVAAVQVLGRRERLGETEGRDVLRHLASGGDLTRWGMLNAVTRAAQDVESYDRATELEELGGKILAYVPSDWRALTEAAA